MEAPFRKSQGCSGSLPAPPSVPGGASPSPTAGTTTPLPPFFVSADSKGLNISCKWFRMNTCGDFVEVFILKGLWGQKNR